MNLMLTASPEHEDLVKRLRIDMDHNLERQLHPNECCIYRVHRKLCNVNEEAYTPQMVSIGPLYHENKGLANMEKIKRSYIKNFLEQRITIEKQDDIFSFVKNNENKIHTCYSEISNLESHEYIMMILYNVIFIIELFMRNYEERSDSFLSTMARRNILISDFELLENQLSYFVLKEICKLASCSNMPFFMRISCSFFEFFTNLRLIELTSQFSVKHFTDWKRSVLLEKYEGSLRFDSDKGYIWDLSCAMRLNESGVKFKKIDGQGELLFEKHKHELQLVIIDECECICRNVMALEQCLYPFDTHICNYVYLMSCLINTEKDVDLLVGSGIISNLIADKSSVVDMFDKLCQNISVSPSCYYEIGEELKKYCDRLMPTSRRVYFRNLWGGTGTIAAVILLLLIVIQTICSILLV